MSPGSPRCNYLLKTLSEFSRRLGELFSFRIRVLKVLFQKWGLPGLYLSPFSVPRPAGNGVSTTSTGVKKSEVNNA